MAFKMKGSPMQRNFGIGSPLKRNDVYIDGVLQTQEGELGAYKKGLSEEKANKRRRASNQALATQEQNEKMNVESSESKSTTSDKIDAGTIGNKGEKKTSNIVYTDGPRGNDATRRTNLELGVNERGYVTGKKVSMDPSATTSETKPEKKSPKKSSATPKKTKEQLARMKAADARILANRKKKKDTKDKETTRRKAAGIATGFSKSELAEQKRRKETSMSLSPARLMRKKLKSSGATLVKVKGKKRDDVARKAIEAAKNAKGSPDPYKNKGVYVEPKKKPVAPKKKKLTLQEANRRMS